MKNIKGTTRVTVATLLVAIVVSVAAIAPNPAFAAPSTASIGDVKTVVAYRVFPADKAAIVVTTKGKVVTIPQKIKYKGTTYRVRGILALGKDVRTVKLNAKIEFCADERLWGCKVYTPYKSMYKWLRSTGCKRCYYVKK